MKKTLFLISALAVLAVSSCKKKYTPPTEPPKDTVYTVTIEAGLNNPNAILKGALKLDSGSVIYLKKPFNHFLKFDTIVKIGAHKTIAFAMWNQANDPNVKDADTTGFVKLTVSANGETRRYEGRYIYKLQETE